MSVMYYFDEFFRTPECHALIDDIINGFGISQSSIYATFYGNKALTKAQLAGELSGVFRRGRGKIIKRWAEATIPNKQYSRRLIREFVKKIWGTSLSSADLKIWAEPEHSGGWRSPEIPVTESDVSRLIDLSSEVLFKLKMGFRKEWEKRLKEGEKFREEKEKAWAKNREERAKKKPQKE